MVQPNDQMEVAGDNDDGDDHHRRHHYRHCHRRSHHRLEEDEW